MTTPDRVIAAALEQLATLPVHAERLADRHIILDDDLMWIADARSGTAAHLVTVLNELPALLALHERVQASRREWSKKASDHMGDLFRARRRIDDLERTVEQLRRDLTEANATIQTLRAGGSHP